MMSHFDITSAQYDVMLGIESLGKAATPKAIADALLVTKGNITSVTRRLHERALITQESHSQDKRSIVLKLSPEGMEILNNAKKAARSFVQTQLAPFSDDEVEDVGSLMKQMRDHLNSSEFDQDISQILQEIKLAGVSG
jgi:DNA-binding MarR family transcriptional regulator